MRGQIYEGDETSEGGRLVERAAIVLNFLNNLTVSVRHRTICVIKRDDNTEKNYHNTANWT